MTKKGEKLNLQSPKSMIMYDAPYVITSLTVCATLKAYNNIKLSYRHAVRGTRKGQWEKRPAYPKASKVVGKTPSIPKASKAVGETPSIPKASKD